MDPTISINIEGKITDVNKATITITGMNRDRLIGSNYFDYFTEPQKAREACQEAVVNGFVTDSALTVRHIDGKLSDVLLHATVYKDDEGNAEGIVLVSRDINGH